jgi:hypothetical protein
MTKEPRVISTQIPANETLSGGIDIGDAEHIAIEFPDTTTINNITFQAKPTKFADSDINGLQTQDWDNVYDDTGTEISVAVASNRIVVLGTVTKAALCACRYIRVRSGTSASPVTINPGINIRFIVK